MYAAAFDENWPVHFNRLDNELKERVAKKIAKILEQPFKRHLKRGANYFVDEVGQHRIAYRVFETPKQARFYFVGTHKEYERWYRQFF
ncbi:MAG TPA: hypothetical protein HA252_00695 [Candidatus Diapherotrites archaeon]|uniref:Type II toxin-antitoxin system RelE/ParE family toxin n=1 Tax=Candidatus Iainarchaeum sp. TaxID=3101447 RepID=A0A7J4JIZ5_9ARCH|nr:hypothetical protein [Candidatus Diapherotrites archaeon]HIH15907.1 hypothetical protein [Candidatus Diapherotrites archaeon]